MRSRRRALEAVIIWFAIALAGRPPTVTSASLGYTFAVWLVSGTTTTQYKAIFAGLPLTTTAGRVLRISPPTDGSNETHPISPLLIGCIPDQPFTPLLSFIFMLLVTSHLLVGGKQFRLFGVVEFLDLLANYIG